MMFFLEKFGVDFQVFLICSSNFVVAVDAVDFVDVDMMVEIFFCADLLLDRRRFA